MQTYLILLRIGRWLLVRAQLSWLVFNWSKESVKGRHVMQRPNEGRGLVVVHKSIITILNIFTMNHVLYI